MKTMGWPAYTMMTAFLILMLFLPVKAEEPAAQGAAETEYEIVTITDVDFSPSSAANAFVQRYMYPSRATGKARGGTQGSMLEGANRNLYLFLEQKIHAVATGQETSTVFTISAEELYPQTVFTAQDFGTEWLRDENGNFNQEALNQFTDAVNAANVHTVTKYMLMDFPYDLYWYDKSTRVGEYNLLDVDFFTSADEWTISGSVTYYFYVSQDYQGNDMFSVDPKYGTGTAQAAANAKAIADELGTIQDDYTRLRAYKNRICDLAEYNHDAWGDGGPLQPYGNPWQLIWVFDGNPETKVVCEGYSKAFKYLNDISAKKVTVLTILGQCNNENHMWNIVQMDDGKNYLVDVTNCDIVGEGKYTDWLFLVGTAQGSVAEGYTIHGLRYTYRTGEAYTDSQVTLAARNYLDRIGWDYIPAADGECVITAYLGNDPIISVPDDLDGYRVTGLQRTEGSMFGSDTVRIYLPDGLQTISGPVFQNCSRLTWLIIPKGVRNLESGTFQGCTGLSQLIIASEIPNLEQNALSGLTADVYVPHGAEAWTEDASELAGGGRQLIRYCNALNTPYLYTAVHTERTEPTCTGDGTMEYWTCMVCGAVFSDEAGIIRSSADEMKIPAMGHSYRIPVFRLSNDENSCAADFICEREDDTQTVTAEVVETATVLPTCTAEGETTYTVQAVFQGQTYTGQFTVGLAMLPHTLEGHPKVEPTCTEGGVGAYWVCTECGKMFQDAESTVEIEAPVEIEPLGHDMTAHERVEPTCLKAGTEGYWECGVCEKLFLDEEGTEEITEPVVLEKIPHTPVIQRATLPSFTEPGWYGRTLCGMCGEELEAGEMIPILTPVSESALQTPSGLKKIEAEAFAGISAESIRIADGVTAIGDGAFSGCKELRQIYIPESVTEMGDGLFEGGSVILVIIGEAGSKAETFAEENGILFKTGGEP